MVRTALSLSALGGEPFRMERVRGDRPNPGLKRQHLACVEAVAALTDADVEGAAVGSETLQFDPVVRPDAAAAPDEVAVDIGTAGSATLVADTLLPLATRIDEPLHARVTGGTDVRWSPSADYLRRVKLPLLRAFGLDADASVERRGFFPAGGGRLDLRLRPSSLAPIELGLHDGVRAPVTDPRIAVYAAAADDVADGDPAGRLADAAVTALGDRDLAGNATATTASVEADSTGAVLTVVVADAAVPGSTSGRAEPRAGFVAYGDTTDAPSSLADTAADAVERWQATDAPVDANLGDQLVVWLAIAGGAVPIPRVTDHVRTNVELVSAFGYDVAIEARGDGIPSIVSPTRR
nr:RNA 3'-terminal phosphate cyclase [Halobellus ruber]